MSRYREQLDAYAEQTETADADMAQARDRWDATRLERVNSRGAQTAWSFPMRMLLAGGMVAAAAALLIQLAPSGLDPQQPMALGDGAAVDVTLREGISISGDGQGVLSGTLADRHVALESGTMRFEVTPDAGLKLAVETVEGTVTVVGTVFDVSRDELGTAVTVERGKVRVACAGSEGVLLTAGMPHSCPSALGFLKTGRALQAEGAAQDTVLASISGAGSVPAEPVIRAELDTLTVDSLSRLGRHSEALEGAERFLADATLVNAVPERAVEMQRLAARAADAVGGCDRAMPWLDALRLSGADGTALVQYARCVGAGDPAEARAALEDALALDLEPALAEKIRGMLGQ